MSAQFTPGARSGQVVLGNLKQPMRNGSTTVVMMWEAVLLPERVCEGGGWYSAHPTNRRWALRTWLAHKAAPGWSWPKVAGPHDGEDLEAAVAQQAARYRRNYGFATREPETVA